MDKQKNLAVALLTVLAGCTAPYRPPTVTPPEEWMGSSGWTVKSDGIKVLEGVRREGDVLLEYSMTFARTAVVLETVQTHNPYGHDFVIPAGTKLFAMNFTLKGGQAIDPIEWGAVLPHGVDGKQKGSDTVCVFWETPTRARYKRDDREGGVAFNPHMVVAGGVAGPVPRIEVQPVDFGVEIVSRLRVVKIDEKQIELETVMSDGSSEERTESRTLRWDGGGKASYENVIGQFNLTASDGYSSVQFAQVAPDPTLPIVRVCVDSTGALMGNPQIEMSSGNVRSDTAAINIARRGRYTPGSGNDGVDCFKFRVKFELRRP
jgi:hypothetical protein